MIRSNAPNNTKYNADFAVLVASFPGPRTAFRTASDEKLGGAGPGNKATVLVSSSNSM